MSAPKDVIIDRKESIVPAVVSASSSQAVVTEGGGNLIREQAIVREVNEKPILAEVVHRPSVEVRNRTTITEVHEKPQIEFREVPMVVTTREQPLYRQFAEKMRVEDFTTRELIQNPYLTVQPKVMQETPITKQVNEGAIVREIHEQPIIEIHHQPIVREIHEKPIIEIHEQEIIRKYTDTPIVRVTRLPEQQLMQQQGMAVAAPGAAVIGSPAPVVMAAPTDATFIQQQQAAPMMQQQPQLQPQQPMVTPLARSASQPMLSSSGMQQQPGPVLAQNAYQQQQQPMLQQAAPAPAPAAPVVAQQQPMLQQAAPAPASWSPSATATTTVTTAASNASTNTVVQQPAAVQNAELKAALAEQPPVYVETGSVPTNVTTSGGIVETRRGSFTEKVKRVIGI